MKANGGNHHKIRHRLHTSYTEPDYNVVVRMHCSYLDDDEKPYREVTGFRFCEYEVAIPLEAGKGKTLEQLAAEAEEIFLSVKNDL